MSYGWYPIASAPKDGRRILVVWSGHVEIATWAGDVDYPAWQEWPDGDFSIADSEVTHWMPMPPLPCFVCGGAHEHLAACAAMAPPVASGTEKGK
jgi:hypothetical protein